MCSNRDSVGARLGQFLRRDIVGRRLEIAAVESPMSGRSEAIGTLHLAAKGKRYVVNFRLTDDLDGDIDRALISADAMLTPPPVKVDLPGAEWLDANERSVGEMLAKSLMEDGHAGAASFIRDCVSRAARHAEEVKNG